MCLRIILPAPLPCSLSPLNRLIDSFSPKSHPAPMWLLYPKTRILSTSAAIAPGGVQLAFLLPFLRVSTLWIRSPMLMPSEQVSNSVNMPGTLYKNIPGKHKAYQGKTHPSADSVITVLGSALSRHFRIEDHLLTVRAIPGFNGERCQRSPCRGYCS